MRCALFKPGATQPYAIYYRPVAPVPAGTVVMLAGSGDFLEQTRGGFPGQAQVTLSSSVKFTHGDWLRVWLDGDRDDDPTYLGELMGEPWRQGKGQLRARSLFERVKKCRWVGKASGTFNQYMNAVLSRADLPLGMTYQMPDLPPVFEADTAFELLGDTLSAVEPALDGYLFGVTNRGVLTCLDPGSAVTHRFPLGSADTPSGGTDNYANSVRFSYEFPSGDTGYFEGQDQAQIAAHGGAVWDVSQATVREIGLPEQPFEGYGLTVNRRVLVGGQDVFAMDGRFNTTLNQFTAQQIPEGYSLARLEPQSPPAEVPEHPEIDARAIDLFRHRLALRFQVDPQPKFVTDDGKTKTPISVEVRLRLDATTLPDVAVADTFIRETQENSTFSPSIGIKPDYDHPDDPSYVLLPNYSFVGVTNVPIFYLSYKPEFVTQVRSLGKKLKPIRILEVLTPYTYTLQGDIIAPTSTYVGEFRNVKGETAVYEELIATGQAGQNKIADIKINTNLFDSSAPLVTAADLLNKPTIAAPDGTVVMEFVSTLNLPFGSVIELEAVSATSGTGMMWACSDASITPSSEDVQQYGYPVALLKSVGAAPSGAVTVLKPTEKKQSPDGWLAFAVRGPDGLAGQGDPPPDVQVKRLILTGMQGIGRIRIKTPYFVGLADYGARLLWYKTQPVREWTGQYRTLKRVGAGGLAAFEVPDSPDDVLLEVQKVTYQLSGGVTVAAGTPLPTTDEDAVAGAIQDVQRVIRRAGGDS